MDKGRWLQPTRVAGSNPASLSMIKLVPTKVLANYSTFIVDEVYLYWDKQNYNAGLVVMNPGGPPHKLPKWWDFTGDKR